MARGYGDCNAMSSDIGDGLLWQKIRCEARTSDLGDGELFSYLSIWIDSRFIVWDSALDFLNICSKLRKCVIVPTFVRNLKMMCIAPIFVRNWIYTKKPRFETIVPIYAR